MKRFYKIVVAFSLLFTLGMVVAYQVINTCLESNVQSNQNEAIMLKHFQQELYKHKFDAKTIFQFLEY